MDDIERPAKKKTKTSFLLEDFESSAFPDLWWNMPSMDMVDAAPHQKITVNFLTKEDVEEFCEKLQVLATPATKFLWYPPIEKMGRKEFLWVGEKVSTKYPVYIPSKGRADCQLTGKALDEMGVKYHFVVEETEEKIYKKHLGKDKVLVLPFHDLGQGSIPARNWIWEHAISTGAERHWIMDDNIRDFRRCHKNRRVVATTGAVFCAMEDFVDRFENIALAGPHDVSFVVDRQYKKPYLLNSRIYSCILIKNDLPYRWRGRYNEDTDLSLRALKDGWVTVLFHALLMKKIDTAFSKSGGMKGGNTDNVYNTGDYRKAFAESLKQQHPDVVKVVWKFNRWHHQVDYRPFRNNKPILKKGITPVKKMNEYGMRLVKTGG